LTQLHSRRVFMLSHDSARQPLHVLDPSYAMQAGHHHDLNAALRRHISPAVIWCDQALVTAAHQEAVFSAVGDGADQHWWALPVAQQLALRLQQQLVASERFSLAGTWLAHSLLPFQVLGLAYALTNRPSCWLVISLMFDPTETLSTHVDSCSNQAERTSALAWLELARVCRQAGHQLRFGAASQHTIERHRPLLEQARLPLPSLHPAVCGAGCRLEGNSGHNGLPLVLLHWGDLKPDKGLHEALAVVQALLSGWQPLHPCRFLFHSYSHFPLEPQDHQLLRQVQQQLGEHFLWLNGHVPQAEMQALLAQCELALLAYSPRTYAHRSSGVLWCYAAARRAAGLPATALGYGQHWLQKEAVALGMQWQVPAPGLSWPTAIDAALAGVSTAAPAWTPYATAVLGRSFVDWVAEQLPP
jgi:hypothetical protein